MKKSPKDKDVDPRKNLHQGGHWSPFEHGLSASSIQLFLRCMEQFRLNHQEDLDAIYSNQYLQFGSVLHHVLDKNRVSMKKSQTVLTPKQVKTGVAKMEKELAESVMPSVKSREEFQLTLGLAEVCCNGYINHWKKHDLQKSWIHSEHEFSFMFEDPDVKLNGTLDGVTKDKQGYWILDTKSKSQVNEDNIQDSFTHDLQFMLYMVAGTRLLGETPKGVIYDGVRRPGQRQTQADTSMKVFLERVAKDVTKRSDHYFFRFKAEYGRGEVERWEREQLRPILKTIAMWYNREIPHFVNPAGLLFNNSKSQYFNAITRGDMTGLRRGSHWRKYERV